LSKAGTAFAVAMSVIVRPATEADCSAIAAIYDHHARNGTATFDLEGPSPAEWADKLGLLSSRGWPFLVAETGGEIVGYAYATQFRDRPAYSHTCESSIYVATAHVGQGIGPQLVEALKAAAVTSGFDQMIAVISGGPASIALHRKCGFEERGRMLGVGFKFGRRLDTVYMQCALGSGTD
jgi:phosphinothricin acetyltransferase